MKKLLDKYGKCPSISGISLENGKFYDELFEARQRGDYIELVSFEEKQVEDWLRQASRFVEAIKLLVKNN